MHEYNQRKNQLGLVIYLFFLCKEKIIYKMENREKVFTKELNLFIIIIKIDVFMICKFGDLVRYFLFW